MQQFAARSSVSKQLRSLIYEHQITMLLKAKNILRDFQLTMTSENIEEIYDALLRLAPDRLTTNEILTLVKYAEKKFNRIITEKHFNTFGTGGDEFKTINLSTISSIIASNFTKVWKVGTGAVTSRWGSYDFISKISSVASQVEEPIRKKMFYSEGSGYLSLKSLGLGYSSYLKIARKRLREEGILDIYKLVFPCSNLTNSHGQVNGIYHFDYIEKFIDLSILLNKNSILTHSYLGIDEIYSGKNTIVRIYNGLLTEIELSLTVTNIIEVNDFMSESLNPEEHVLKFAKILRNDCPDEVIIIVAYNVACILGLNDKTLNLEHYANIAFDFIKECQT